MIQYLSKINNRTMLYQGKVITTEQLTEMAKSGKEITIVLPPGQVTRREEVVQPIATNKPTDIKDGQTYLFKVKQYMTKPSTPDFDFHAKWNNNKPMPFRTMVGTVLRQTPGMIKVKCHVEPCKTSTCMRCGRRLSHPVSKLYGIGPECGGHAHINPFETKEELYASLDSLKQQLRQIEWEGWVIRSAIEDFININDLPKED